MSKISCSVDTCSYNKSGICHSGSTKIEGVSANKLNDVHCISFASIEKCMKSDVESECQHIICNAVNCMHNKNTSCVCENIFVSGNSATSCKQTNCCSFITDNK